MKIIITWLVMTLAIILTAYLLPGVFVEDLMTAIIAAAVLGIINAIVRPILIFLTLPITLITLGLFIFVLNALLVLLASNLVVGFSVNNFWWALLFSIVLSIINSVLSAMAK